MVNIGYPWERYGLIVELAERLSEKAPQFGKTAIQKIIYLLQEVFGADCGYEFTLYTYGPYCSDIVSDLNTLNYLKGVDVQFFNSGSWGFRVKPGPEAEAFRNRVSEFLQGVQALIDHVVEEFGHLNTKELELRATIIYADRDNADKDYTRSEFIELIISLKPRFDRGQIEAVIEELEGKQFINVRTDG